MTSTDRCITQFPTMWGRNYLHHGQHTIRFKVSDAQGDNATACGHTDLQLDQVGIQLQTLRCSSKKQYTATDIVMLEQETIYSYRHRDVGARNNIQLQTLWCWSKKQYTAPDIAMLEQETIYSYRHCDVGARNNIQLQTLRCWSKKQNTATDIVMLEQETIYSYRHCDVGARNNTQLQTLWCWSKKQYTATQVNFEGKIICGHRKYEVRSVTI